MLNAGGVAAAVGVDTLGAPLPPPCAKLGDAGSCVEVIALTLASPPATTAAAPINPNNPP